MTYFALKNSFLFRDNKNQTLFRQKSGFVLKYSVRFLQICLIFSLFLILSCFLASPYNRVQLQHRNTCCYLHVLDVYNFCGYVLNLKLQ
jgi:hypothetical protein